jgi:molybdopterin-guanine dinucleotide biosynthesis protein A
MIAHSDIAGLILAGGRGQRFGGLDKGFVITIARSFVTLWMLYRNVTRI